MLKTGQQEKLYSPTNVSVSQQRRPQLLSANFENLVHSIFRNETSTLEINVSHFGVLHWQQWQPPASAPDFCNDDINKFILLLRTGVYPYKEAKYEDITDVDHRHAKRVFKSLNNKNLGDYHDLYVQSDTILLADVFEILETFVLKYMN